MSSLTERFLSLFLRNLRFGVGVFKRSPFKKNHKTTSYLQPQYLQINSMVLYFPAARTKGKFLVRLCETFNHFSFRNKKIKSEKDAIPSCTCIG